MTTPAQIQVTKRGGFKRHFEFLQGEERIGELAFEKTFSSRARGILKGLEWKLRRKGFWQRQINIVAEQSPYTKTHIKLGWRRKMEVRAEDGKMYYFKAVNFWQKTWIWMDSNQQPILEIRSRRLSRKRRGIITFYQPQRQEHLLLILIGWYQLIGWEDQAAAAAG